MEILTVSSALDLVVRLFPDVTRNAGMQEVDLPPLLPRPLAEIYLRLGRAIGREVVTTQSLTGYVPDGKHTQRTRFLQTQDRLRRLDELKIVEGGMVDFAWENQGCWDWRTPNQPGDLAVISQCMDESLEDFGEVSDRLSEFLQTFLIREALFATRDHAGTEDPGDSERLMRPLKLGAPYASWRCDLFWIEEGDILVNHEMDTWWFGSNSVDPTTKLGLTDELTQ